MPDQHVKYTVEKLPFEAPYIGTHGIRYTPAPLLDGDGKPTITGFSFFCLLAGDVLENAEEALKDVADRLNDDGILNHRGYSSTPDLAVADSHILNLATSLYDEDSGWHGVMEILEPYLDGSVDADGTVSAFYEALGITEEPNNET